MRHKSKGKKLRYEKLDSTWGLDLNEMERLEEHELARNRFLNSGPGLCKIGEGCKQATIRVWSAREVFARDIMKNCFDTAWDQIMDRIPESESISESEKSKVDNEERTKDYCSDDDIPAGWLTEECWSKEGQTVNDTTSKLCFGHPKIHTFFSKKAIFDYDIEIRELEKDQRLQLQKRKELVWKDNRYHWTRRKWVAKMIEGGYRYSL